MLLQPVILGSQNVMNAVDGATTERRIRINRPDEGRGRCKKLSAWDPRKDFSQCMPHPQHIRGAAPAHKSNEIILDAERIMLQMSGVSGLPEETCSNASGTCGIQVE